VASNCVAASQSGNIGGPNGPGAVRNADIGVTNGNERLRSQLFEGHALTVLHHDQPSLWSLPHVPADSEFFEKVDQCKGGVVLENVPRLPNQTPKEFGLGLAMGNRW
jgi:hypothetical protein